MDFKEVIFLQLLLCSLCTAMTELANVEVLAKDPNTMRVHFKKMGRLAPAPTMVHVKIPVPGKVISEFTHQLVGKMEHFLDGEKSRSTEATDVVQTVIKPPAYWEDKIINFHPYILQRPLYEQFFDRILFPQFQEQLKRIYSAGKSPGNVTQNFIIAARPVALTFVALYGETMVKTYHFLNASLSAAQHEAFKTHPNLFHNRIYEQLLPIWLEWLHEKYNQGKLIGSFSETLDLTLKEVSRDVGKEFLSDLRYVLSGLDGTLELLGAQERLEKRFWQFIGSILSLAANIYNYFVLSGISTHIDNVQKKSNNLVTVFQLAENALANLDFRVHSAVEVLDLAQSEAPERLVSKAVITKGGITRATETFMDTVHKAREGQLSRKLLTSEALLKIKEHVDQVALEKNMVSPLQSAQDIFSMPVSTLFNKTSRDLILFLHVPLVKAEHLMTLYEFLPLPLKLDEKKIETVVPSPQEPYIAVRRDTHLALTKETLEKCIELSGVYYCLEENQLNTEDDHTCISSLFFKKDSGIFSKCELQVMATQEYTYKLDANTWMVSTPFEYVAQVQCSQKRDQVVNLQGTVILKIRPGCTLEGRQFELHANDFGLAQTLHLEGDLTWDLNLSTLLNVSVDDFSQDLHLFRTTGIWTFKLTDYTYLKEKYHFSTFHWGMVEWIHLGIMLAFAVATYLIFYKARKSMKCAQNMPAEVGEVKMNEVMISRAMRL